MVKNMVAILSKEKADGSCAYANMDGTKNETTIEM